jgi:hypothetical protein
MHPSKTSATNTKDQRPRNTDPPDHRINTPQPRHQHHQPAPTPSAPQPDRQPPPGAPPTDHSHQPSSYYQTSPILSQHQHQHQHCHQPQQTAPTSTTSTTNTQPPTPQPQQPTYLTYQPPQLSTYHHSTRPTNSLPTISHQRQHQTLPTLRTQGSPPPIQPTSTQEPRTPIATINHQPVTTIYLPPAPSPRHRITKQP